MSLSILALQPHPQVYGFHQKKAISNSTRMVHGLVLIMQVRCCSSKLPWALVGGVTLRLRAPSAAAAELMAARGGMQMAKGYGIKHFTLEMDAKQLVEWLNRDDLLQHHELFPLIHDVKLLLQKEDDWEVTLTHINCRINCVANFMATLGRQQHHDLQFHNYPPRHALDVYTKDIEGCMD